MDRRGVLGAATLGVAAGAAFALANRPVPLLTTPLAPTSTLDDARRRFENLVARDEAEAIDPLCASRLLTHGERTERAVVLYHGYTNCPLQLAMLGDLLHEAGNNVLIPRIPRQGLADKMTDELSRLTSDELAAFTASTVDIASGLGERVTAFGFSGGGTLASYAGHEMDAVSEVVLVAPLIGLYTVPNVALRAVYRLISVMPEFYMWWNPLTRGEGPYSPRAYPRFSVHGLAAYLQLALGLRDTVPGRTTDLDRTLVIVNENDLAVDNALAVEYAQDVLGPWSDRLEAIVLPSKLGLHHDWLDPLGIDGDRIDRGYPLLLDLLGAAQTS
jgi:carboxylesterase